MYQKWRGSNSAISDIITAISDCGIVRSKKQCFYNAPCAFDIETSSFMYKGEKAATMYIWMFAVKDLVYMGRTWDEWVQFCKTLSLELGLHDELRLIIYVHNLGYEFQFMRKWFEWTKVFSLEKYVPLYAINNLGIEYRCSWKLAGLSLAKVGENLQKYHVKKLIGDLDYSKVRHSKTSLTFEELSYCANDVLVVTAYIQECIEQEGNISKIPLTVTGYARRYCRQSCLYVRSTGKRYRNKKYDQKIMDLTMDESEYKQLKRAFQGGFTHANAMHSGKICAKVSSEDFTSSYPYVMISEKFPMSKGRLVPIGSKKEAEYYMKYYCCVFDVEFIELKAKVAYENYLSESRGTITGKSQLNNGRVVYAERYTTTITEIDYGIIKEYYSCQKMKITNFRIYEKNFLPTELVTAILQLYRDKTKLKGVKGKEEEYLKAKGLLNSIYGTSVTDPVKDLVTYDEEWGLEEKDISDELSHYNNSKNRFLFYAWGVWVTAYARRNLFTGISEFKEDYIYSDTDSIKVFNLDKHQNYIDNYNRMVKIKLKQAMEYHGLDYSMCEPQTIKGKVKPIGVWDYEGTYHLFKTLGAKRYLTMKEKTGTVEMTVGGLNKKVGCKYLVSTFGRYGAFIAFSDELVVPSQWTGKLTHTYLNDEQEGIITDYLGNENYFHELSSIHLEPQDYSMNLTEDYLRYLEGVYTFETH